MLRDLKSTEGTSSISSHITQRHWLYRWQSSSSDSLQTYFSFTSFYVRGPVLVELQKVVHDNLRCGRCGPSIFQAKRGFDIWQHANLNRINSLNSAFYNCYVIQLTFTAFSLLFIINLCLDFESIELYVEWDFELYVMHKLCTYTYTRLRLWVVHIDTSVSINNIRKGPYLAAE